MVLCKIFFAILNCLMQWKQTKKKNNIAPYEEIFYYLTLQK